MVDSPRSNASDGRTTIRGILPTTGSSNAPKAPSAKKRMTLNAVSGYVGVFLLVISLVAVGYQPPEQLKPAASAVEVSSSRNDSNSNQTLSVDDLVATSVATNIAQAADLPVATNVANLSQSIAAESVLAQNDDHIVTKPQIVQASADTRDIRTYTAKTGDTVPEIAKRYNLSARTVKWANSLESDAVEPGRKLKILPTDGVLYTVRSGDTLESVADRYKASVEQVRTYNDLELGGFKAGKQLIIPEGNLPTAERPGYVAPAPTYSSGVVGNQGINFGNYSGGSASGNTYSATGGNRYAFGNCTWYAYERRVELGRPVGSFWGNASSWGWYASSEGYAVNGTPTVGSIMVNGGGYGHVSIVESVSPGNSITISEMNAYRFGGGFNRIGRGTIPWSEAVSGMYQYIQ